MDLYRKKSGKLQMKIVYKWAFENIQVSIYLDNKGTLISDSDINPNHGLLARPQIWL